MIARVASALACAAMLSACGGSVPDNGTVDACFLTIGVAMPGRDSKLGSTNGWRTAGERAAAEAKHPAVHAAGVELVAALSAEVVAGGFTDAEIARYAAAAMAMEKGCKDSNAFDGEPAGRRDPFGTAT